MRQTTKTLHDILRERLLVQAGVLCAPKVVKDFDLAALRESEWSTEFEQLMRNRLLMGSMRYETFAAKANLKTLGYAFIDSIFERLKLYQQGGNTEHLVDVANCCLLEYEFGKHPKKHFAPVDDGVHVQLKKGGK